ncbi:MULTISPECIES: methionyl-tRNA formyltransferase [unclassified Nocardiopsis]|uniref:methionyl-tRNA formyltransferase n=1 Tax=unclassified Nocardiopsis TaxID=2649073 RepID=UPI0013586A28|nr:MULTISPECIES: formyltransferase family protein [unclassified Nocardiopsis]
MADRRRYCYVSGLGLGAPALEDLCAQGRPPGLVVSYPAEFAHRSGYLDFEALARQYDVPHLRAADLDTEEVRRALAEHGVDLLVVAGWSQPVPVPLVSSLTLGGVALHPAPLPVGRGWAPIPWTILRGMRSSAVTLYHLGGEPGTGDIVDQAWFDVAPDATATALYERVGQLQSELLVRHLDGLLAGTAPRRPQSGHGSVWPRRRPSDGQLDLTAAGGDVDRMVRALADPYPGAFAMFGGARITLCAGRLTDRIPGGAPGQVVAVGQGRRWGVACGDGTVFVPEALRVDEGVRADPASLPMFRPGAFFDEPSPYMLEGTRRSPAPGAVPAARGAAESPQETEPAPAAEGEPAVEPAPDPGAVTGDPSPADQR